MEELVLYHGHGSTSRIEPALATHFSQLGDLALPSEGWRSIYNLKDVTSCAEKVQPVRYTETLSLFSTLNLVAYSSGYSLGSANWLLETSFKRIAFLSCSSLYPNLHPAPFDADILKDADVVVVGDLRQQSERELPYERAKSKLFVHLARTNQSLHNSIIVAPPMGIMFDLIGDIEEYFKSLGKEIGHERHQTPIYVANPIADQSLKYANICGEWMNSGRHDLLYVPQMPLAHGELMNTGAVETVVSLEASVLSETSIREPCIVFTGDSTCITKGPLMWFLNHWGQSELNTCIFIDPNSPQDIQNDIPPDCKMNFLRLPLDTRLRSDEISSLLHTHWQHTDNHTRHLLIPAIQGAELIKEEQPQGIQVHVYDQGVVRINVNRDWERVSLSEKLAKTIDPTMVPNSNGTHFSAWAPINGSLNYYNNRLEIHPSVNVKDSQSLVLGHKSELRIHTELNAIIKRFEEVRMCITLEEEEKKKGDSLTEKIACYTHQYCQRYQWHNYD
ncbi:beta-lactamase-like protein [Parasitella parasitica]|nr:beta-lactamase-like protein [Parasitella parasitica]